MAEKQSCEFTGWVKWVIVVASVLTILDKLLEFGKGILAGWGAYH
ncbi:MAG TPA: hypothetical protein VKM93_02075 [Terriglobia bacterium]|nr:hypothetical protein [Terriglobia bacterium]